MDRKNIPWGKLDQKMKIAEAIGAGDVKKSITLAACLEAYQQAEGIDFPRLVKIWSDKALEVLDGKRQISSLTVKDAMNVFTTLDKEGNSATAYRARAILANSMRYVLKGEGPPKRTPYARQGSEGGDAAQNGVDIGKLKFSVAKISAIAGLVPLYEVSGRFGWIKAEVQKQIYALAEDEAGVIEAPKRSMTDKEAKAITTQIQKMFKKGNLPWVIKYNPNETVFVVMRLTDFQKLTNQNIHKKAGK